MCVGKGGGHYVREGETPGHCYGSGSNGIRLMTKLIEGLTPAGTDKASSVYYCICIFVFCVSIYVCVLGLH